MSIRHLTSALVPLLAIILFLPIGGELYAQPSLVFSDDAGGTFGSDFEATVGVTVTVGIYLNNATTGLDTFQLDLSHTPGLGTVTNSAPDDEFDGTPTSIGPLEELSSTGFVWDRLHDTGGNLPDAGETRVRLGSFDYLITAAGDTLFTVADAVTDPLALPGWNAGSLASLDGFIFGFSETETFQFTISGETASVPEPSSGLLIGFSMLATMIRRRRNRS